MHEIRQVADGLYRGPMPEVKLLKELKFRSILDLETQTRELLWGDPNKQFRDAQQYNMIYFDMAFSGIFPPKPEDIYSALGVLKWGRKPLYFHCRHGRERTGYLAAVYRMQAQSWTFEDAYAEWIQMGCRWPTSWLWKKSLRQYEVVKGVEIL